MSLYLSSKLAIILCVTAISAAPETEEINLCTRSVVVTVTRGVKGLIGQVRD